jgi:hypothetical protein
LESHAPDPARFPIEGNPTGSQPESTDDLESKSAFAQFGGHFEPLCVFTSQVEIDYRPKSRLTWGDVDIHP